MRIGIVLQHYTIMLFSYRNGGKGKGKGVTPTTHYSVTETEEGGKEWRKGVATCTTTHIQLQKRRREGKNGGKGLLLPLIFSYRNRGWKERNVEETII